MVKVEFKTHQAVGALWPRRPFNFALVIARFEVYKAKDERAIM